jgi:hypothetical protein
LISIFKASILPEEALIGIFKATILPEEALIIVQSYDHFISYPSSLHPNYRF